MVRRRGYGGPWGSAVWNGVGAREWLGGGAREGLGDQQSGKGRGWGSG